MEQKISRNNLYQQLVLKRTPLHEIQNIKIPNNNRIFAKEEWLNPTSSLFDRIYLELFKNAESNGLIVPGITPVIEASTGNAGASFAYYAKKLGYEATVITHADTPKARVEQIKNYGANVIFSPAGQYAKGYVNLLEKILENDKKDKGKIGEDPTRLYCITKINPEAKKPLRKLVDEVYKQLREYNKEKIDNFICVVGSGTTISGIGERLKEKNLETQIIALDHIKTPVLQHLMKDKIFDYEGNKMPHQLFGISAFGLPKEKLDINFNVIDKVWLIDDSYWQKGCKFLSKQENKPVGRSSGASLYTALKLSKQVKNQNILILFFDAAWKYENKYPYFK